MWWNLLFISHITSEILLIITLYISCFEKAFVALWKYWLYNWNRLQRLQSDTSNENHNTQNFSMLKLCLNFSWTESLNITLGSRCKLFHDSVWQYKYYKGVYQNGENGREENKKLWKYKLPFAYIVPLCTCATVRKLFLNAIWINIILILG